MTENIRMLLVEQDAQGALGSLLEASLPTVEDYLAKRHHQVGFELRRSDSTKEALQMIVQEGYVPELILGGIGTKPGFDGEGFLKKILEMRKAGQLPEKLRYIVVTGFSREDYGEAADGFLGKPYGPNDLAHEIGRVLYGIQPSGE